MAQRKKSKNDALARREVVVPEIVLDEPEGPSDPVSTLARRDQKKAKRIRERIAKSQSERTRHEYRSDIRAWKRWCLLQRGLDESAVDGLGIEQLDAQEDGFFPITPDALLDFADWMAEKGLKISTVRRRCTGLADANSQRGFPNPISLELRKMLRGLARERKVRTTKKQAISPEMLWKMVHTIDPDSPTALRDRTILLVGWFTAMRRSELVAMEWSHIKKTSNGYSIWLPSSKTNQYGQREEVKKVVYGKRPFVSAAHALDEWREQNVEDGLVFGLSGRTVARIVKRYIEAAGEDPTNFSGHSLRSGFVTAGSSVDGATTFRLMEQSGHRSEKVLQGYIQQSGKPTDNPVVLGLSAWLDDLEEGSR